MLAAGGRGAASEQPHSGSIGQRQVGITEIGRREACAGQHRGGVETEFAQHPRNVRHRADADRDGRLHPTGHDLNGGDG